MSEKYLNKDGLAYALQKINTVIENKNKEKEKIDFYGCYDFSSYFYTNPNSKNFYNRTQPGISAIVPLKRIDISNIPDIELTLTFNEGLFLDIYFYDGSIYRLDSNSENSGKAHVLTLSKHDTVTAATFNNTGTITYEKAKYYIEHSFDVNPSSYSYTKHIMIAVREDKETKGIFDIFLICVLTNKWLYTDNIKKESCTIKHLYWNVTQDTVMPDRNYSFSDLPLDIVVRSADDIAVTYTDSAFYNTFIENFSTYNTVFNSYNYGLSY